MEKIMEMTKQIDYLMHKAKHDAKKAIKLKADDPETAAMYLRHSQEKMERVLDKHKEIAEMISEYREKNGNPPANMQKMYDYLHEKYLHKAQKIKGLQAAYKDE